MRIAFFLGVSLLTCCLVNQALCQTVSFGAKAYVDQYEKEINSQFEVDYHRSKRLDVYSNVEIMPNPDFDVDVRVRYRFRGELSDGSEYDSGWATVTTSLGMGGQHPYKVAGWHVTMSSRNTWTYECVVEQKVNGDWVGITGGQLTILFLDSYEPPPTPPGPGEGGAGL